MPLEPLLENQKIQVASLLDSALVLTAHIFLDIYLNQSASLVVLQVDQVAY